TYKKRMGTIFEFHETQYGKTGTRADTWIPNLKAGLEHPITGLGAGMSLYVNGMLFSDWHAVHNSFVQACVETGLIGFFFYILLFIIPFKQYRQMIKRNSTLTGDDLLRMKAIMIAFIACSSTGFFLPKAYTPILFLLTGFFLIQRELITRRTVISMQKTGYRRRSDRIMKKNKQVEPLIKSRYFA
ncbi:MAG: O-antigen ligase family protein, partial [Deltaproteobacteria bacterium]|nr:O-antigen ligase family protein [Deltaproteobacteria bacterium]